MTAGIPDDELFELVEYASEPWGHTYPATPATGASLARIADELGIVVPPLLIGVSRHCRSYGGWFASIGEDYQSWMHLVALNRAFREAGLPDHLVMLNHGHDGDCDCFVAGGNEPGEYEIEFWRVHENRRPAERVRTIAPGFRDYLVDYCRHHAPRTTNRARRRRAKRLLAERGL